MNDQISKRVHCFDQQRIVTYCIFRHNTIIEELIKQKRKNEFGFEKEIFIKMQEKNEKNVIAENNVEINFVKEVLIVMLKLI